MMEMGKTLTVVFVDYSAAFDSISHKFLDTALKEAGASPKVRVICHTIYKTVSAFTTVKGVDNKQVRCDNFQIDRGVLQEGDIISLLFFILALELILGRHDPKPAGQGVPLVDTLIRLLGYEDDLAVTEVGEEDGVCRIEKRVNDIVKGSSDDADMQVNTVPDTGFWPALAT